MHKLLLIILLFLANIINAGTIVVQNINDSGIGSLRQATIDAVGGDTIRFNPNLIANGNDTIKLTSEIAFNKGLVFKGLYNATDSLFISGQDSVRIFNVDLDTSFIKTLIIDSLIFINGNAGSFNGGAVLCGKADTLKILNTIIKKNKATEGGGIFYKPSLFTLLTLIVVENCSINSNNSSFGGGIYMPTSSSLTLSKVKILNSSIENNYSLYSGGGAYLSSRIDSVIIRESIINNNSGSNGGGFAITNNTYNLNIINSKISNNIARTGYGGGISYYSQYSTKGTVSNCVFENNIANNKGGGIHFSSADSMFFQVLNSRIIYNKAQNGQGGGVYLTGDYSSAHLRNSLVNNNSGRSGGGVFISSLDKSLIMEITNSEISKNSALFHGGGVYSRYALSAATINNELTISVNNSTISNNTGHTGGGIYSWSEYSKATVNISKSTLNNNSVSNLAGAIYCGDANANSIIKLNESTISANFANWGAGGIYSSSVEVINSTIVGNLANNGNGNGIFVEKNPVKSKSSIIALNGNQNIATPTSVQIDELTSLGYNIFSDTPTGTLSSSDQLNVDSSSLDLLLLSYNGGTTKTILPSLNSVAIDMGNPLDNSDAQNGSFNGRRDVGAAETCISAIYDTLITCSNYTFAGQIHNISGVYYDSLFSVNGCDSIITLFLTIDSAFQDTLSPLVICAEDSALIFGNYEEQSGFYDSISSSQPGCNIVIIQEVKVNSIYEDTLPIIRLCSNDSIFVFDRYQLTSGIYYDSLSTINGCDSVRVQELVFDPAYNDTLVALTICNNDSVLMFDEYKLTPGFYYDSLSSINGCDSVITQELIVVPAYNDTLVEITICNNDSVFVFGNYELTSGFYYDSLSTINGCDSILIQELIVFPISLTVSISGSYLLSSQQGASYQWINCSNGNVVINGATNSLFQTGNDDDYAVIVSTANCSDTSECFSVNSVGLTEIIKTTNPSVYPNPNTGLFTIDFEGGLKTNTEVTILNVLGEKVMQIFPKSQSEQIDLSSFENGIYFVKVSNDNFSKIVRVIKQ